jgi:hypothetical protein
MTPGKMARAIKRRGFNSFGENERIAREAVAWLRGDNPSRDFKIEIRRHEGAKLWRATLLFGVLGYSAATPLIAIDTDGNILP